MNNRIKYLRRAAVTSVCAAALCLACMIPATLALFRVSVTNEGSLLRVGSFSGAGQAVAVTDSPLEEPPTDLSSAALCREGTYELQLTWQGDTDGYIRVDIDYPPAEEPAPIAEDGELPGGSPAEEVPSATLQTLIFQFPAPEQPGEGPSLLTLPMTLHEDAVVTVTDGWGIYTPAEGESVRVIHPAEFLLLAEDGGISFGRPFAAAAVLQRTDAEEGEELILPVGEEPVALAPGLYTLTLEWTDIFDAYCVLDLIPAEEDSPLQPLKKLVSLPAEGELEQGAPVVISLDISEPVLLSAVTVKGTADNAERWNGEDTLSYGRRFAAFAVLAELPIEETTESFPLVNDEVLPAGKYALLVDWTAAELDGHCLLAVGEEVYYLSCPVEGEEKSLLFTLDLKEAVPVSLTPVMGALPEGVEPVTDELIVYGARFEGTALMAPVPTEGEPAFEALSEAEYAPGDRFLLLDWTGSNVDGCVLITFTLSPEEEGGEPRTVRYLLSCPVDGEPVILTVTLEESASIRVEFIPGAVEAEIPSVPGDGHLILPVPDTEPAEGSDPGEAAPEDGE